MSLMKVEGLIMGESKKNIRKPSRFGRHPIEGYSVHTALWVEKDGQLFIGGGRAKLLEEIDRLGSIAAAARSMNLTYSNAWLWVDAMNQLSEEPLVTKNTGGVGGGKAVVTEAGHKAINLYKELHDRLENDFDSEVSEEF